MWCTFTFRSCITVLLSEICHLWTDQHSLLFLILLYPYSPLIFFFFLIWVPPSDIFFQGEALYFWKGTFAGVFWDPLTPKPTQHCLLSWDPLVTSHKDSDWQLEQIGPLHLQFYSETSSHEFPFRMKTAPSSNEYLLWILEPWTLSIPFFSLLHQPPTLRLPFQVCEFHTRNSIM